MTDARLYRQHAILMLLAGGNQLAHVALICCVPMLAWDGNLPGCMLVSAGAGWVWHLSRYYLSLANWVRERIERAEGGRS